MGDANPGTSDLSGLCCQNGRCVTYGRYGQGNLTVSGFTDRAKTIRQLYCRTCKKRFSERKGTVFYRAHMPAQQVVSILEHVQDGVGVRQTGRLTRHKPDTVVRYARLAGGHAAVLHERLVALSPPHPRVAVRREVELRR